MLVMCCVTQVLVHLVTSTFQFSVSAKKKLRGYRAM